jgi:hypothetical protein
VKFDLILTNPPFQDTTRRGKTPHKLWIDFTQATINRFLADGGLLGQVTPSSFRSPSSRVLDLMKQHRTALIRFDTEGHFPTVGSTFADYLIYKEPNGGIPTKIVFDGTKSELVLDEEVLYLPTDLTAEGLSIHRKVMFHPEAKLDVRWDYVTCHNIRLRDQDAILSRTRTDRHIHRVFHTNRQIWWSSIRQEFASQRKVMWTRSGYTKPFYDPGTLGGTDAAYYVLVDSDEEGVNLAHNLNLNLMHYIYRTAKWSGFGNERVFASLPELPRERALNDDEVFTLFGLSKAEVAHVRAVVV